MRAIFLLRINLLTNRIFGLDPKCGLDLATPTIDQNSIKTQFDSNSQFGVFFQFGRKLYLQPEFYYATHKESYSISNAASIETKVNTLKVPVMVGLRLINRRYYKRACDGWSSRFIFSERNNSISR